MLRFIVRILANALGIYLAAYFVVNFNFPFNWKSLLLAGFILTIFNVFLKPVIKLLSTPLVLLTLGAFTLVINMLLLWLLAQFMPGLKITGFWAYLWGTLIITVTNWLTELAIKPKPKSE